MIVVGLSAYYHDSAAAVVRDGVLVAAAQEERFTRRKSDQAFPGHALTYCLDEAGITLSQADRVVFYDKPLRKFERLLNTYLAFAPSGFASFRRAIPKWFGERLFQKDLLSLRLLEIDAAFNPAKLSFSEHHFSHAASAFYPSPFDRAAVLTMDGVGEWATTSLAIGDGSDLQIVREINFPHSLGLLYSAFTQYLGFKVNSGEYKVMGLAPYGEPTETSLILDKLVSLADDGSFHLDMQYFDYCTGLAMINERFESLFGMPTRTQEELLTQRHMDIAASLQTVTEEVVLRLSRSIQRETGQENLCLAGGVALNCVANGKVLRDGAWKRLWVQPAAGDAGGAVGAAFAVYHGQLSQPRAPSNGRDRMQGSYLGPAFAQTDIESRLTGAGARFDVCGERETIDATAQALAEGKAIGWFQGRMEFGPRALGGRSILADPRSEAMQRILNLKVKYRESFRPFAPSVLREDVSEWFELADDSPYMLLVAPVAEKHRRPMSAEQRALFGIDKLNVPRSNIPAVTHVDYSARVQTVHADTNPRYYALIRRFKEITGCPVLVNTSFNVRGEPIVCSPEDAFRCFMGSELDMLVVGDCILQKDRQDPSLKLDYKNAFELD